MSSTLLLVLLSLAGSFLAARLPYIIGGNEVPVIEFYPWTGSLHTYNGGYECGCSLVNAEWAVTAASCITSPPFFVRFGSIKRSNGGTEAAVVEVVVHEDYSTSGSYRYNDVAVVRFSALTLTDKIKPIPLGDTEETGNANCHILGWGQLESSAPTNSELLYEAKVSVIANSHCDNDWGNINGGHVCTNSGSTSPRTCVGDTGGPMVCSKSGKFELVGISSWQSSGCNENLYSVYTRVSHYRQWILEKVRPTFSHKDIQE